MFYNKPECIKLADQIYVFKNVVPKEMCDRYAEILDSYTKEDYIEDNNAIDWYGDKMSPSTPELLDLWETVSEIIYPDFCINPQSKVIASRPGQEGMFIHTDSPGRDKAHELTQIDSYATCSLISYGVIAYLSDFNGGEVFYPAFNTDGTLKSKDSELIGELEYKPEKGDVVIHGAEYPCLHGTRPVTSGIRYAYSCFATHLNDLPGTFYPYKSPEYLEKVKDRSLESYQNWLTPIERKI